MAIKKAVIILTPPGSGPLPLARAVPLEFWLLGEISLVESLVDEAIDGGAEEIFFIGHSDKRTIIDYFDQSAEGDLPEGDGSVNKYDGVDLSFHSGTGGFGSDLWKLKSKLRDGPFALISAAGLLLSDESSFKQLSRLFQTSDKPVLGMVEREDSSDFGIKTEKIAEKIHRVKEIEPIKQTTQFSFAGRAILTSIIWEALGDLKKEESLEELSLARLLGAMAEGGKLLYAYHLKGDWFNLNHKEDWLAAVRNSVSSKNE